MPPLSAVNVKLFTTVYKGQFSSAVIYQTESFKITPRYSKLILANVMLSRIMKSKA